MSHADGLARAGDLGGAIRVLRETLELPGLSERERINIRATLARALFLHGNFTEAIAQYETIVPVLGNVTSPRQGVIHLTFGQAYLARSQTPEQQPDDVRRAEAELSRAIEFLDEGDPGLVAAYELRALARVTQANRENVQAGFRDLERAIARGSSNLRLFIVFGKQFFQWVVQLGGKVPFEDLRKSLSVFERFGGLAQTSTEQRDLHRLLGSATMLLSQNAPPEVPEEQQDDWWRQAVAHWITAVQLGEQASDLTPEAVDYAGAADAWISGGFRDEARQVIEQGLQRLPDNEELKQERRTLLFDLGIPLGAAILLGATGIGWIGSWWPGVAGWVGFGGLGVLVLALRPALVTLRQLRHGKEEQPTDAKADQGDLSDAHRVRSSWWLSMSPSRFAVGVTAVGPGQPRPEAKHDHRPDGKKDRDHVGSFHQLFSLINLVAIVKRLTTKRPPPNATFQPRTPDVTSGVATEIAKANLPTSNRALPSSRRWAPSSLIAFGNDRANHHFLPRLRRALTTITRPAARVKLTSQHGVSVLDVASGLAVVTILSLPFIGVVAPNLLSTMDYRLWTSVTGWLATWWPVIAMVFPMTLAAALLGADQLLQVSLRARRGTAPSYDAKGRLIYEEHRPTARRVKHLQAQVQSLMKQAIAIHLLLVAVGMVALGIPSPIAYALTGVSALAAAGTELMLAAGVSQYISWRRRGGMIDYLPDDIGGRRSVGNLADWVVILGFVVRIVPWIFWELGVVSTRTLRPIVQGLGTVARPAWRWLMNWAQSVRAGWSLDDAAIRQELAKLPDDRAPPSGYRVDAASRFSDARQARGILNALNRDPHKVALLTGELAHVQRLYYEIAHQMYERNVLPRVYVVKSTLTHVPPEFQSLLTSRYSSHYLVPASALTFRTSLERNGASYVAEFAPQTMEAAREMADVVLQAEASRDGQTEMEQRLLARLGRNRERVARFLLRAIQRNPPSLVIRNVKGQIVGFIGVAMVHADSAEDLPRTHSHMRRAHVGSVPGSDPVRNHLVDFWVTTIAPGGGTALVDATTELGVWWNAKGLADVQLEHASAYSSARDYPANRPWVAAKYPEASEAELVEHWVFDERAEGEPTDGVIHGLHRRGTPVLVIPQAHKPFGGGAAVTVSYDALFRQRLSGAAGRPVSGGAEG
ncbi:MAG: hypothetical protein Q8R78_04940, partial [Candidatus Omnitrophota bacterium]|nr:hypothetical protein [Candidatus Omnitrophota bacterium]